MKQQAKKAKKVENGKRHSTGYRLLLYIKPYWKELLGSVIAMGIVSLINLSYPYLLGDYLIDRILIKGGNFGLLNLIVLAAILLAFIKGVFSIFKLPH